MIEDWIVLNMKPAQIADELEDIAQEMIDAIDGGEECRGSDSRLSHRAELLKRAAQMIRVSKWLDELDERLRNLKQTPVSNYEERLARLTALDKERTRLLAMTFASQQPGNF